MKNITEYKKFLLDAKKNELKHGIKYLSEQKDDYGGVKTARSIIEDAAENHELDFRARIRSCRSKYEGFIKSFKTDQRVRLAICYYKAEIMFQRGVRSDIKRNSGRCKGNAECKRFLIQVIKNIDENIMNLQYRISQLSERYDVDPNSV